MPRFKNRQTGREINVAPSQADRFAGQRRWEAIDDEHVGEVPDGTIAEILAWANDSPERRQAALYAEKQGKERKTLIEALED
jgi:hypothetical protein